MTVHSLVDRIEASGFKRRRDIENLVASDVRNTVYRTQHYTVLCESHWRLWKK